MQRPIRIGVSVVSLLPYSIGPGGPQRALDLARRAGLEGLQLVPLRGWSDTDIKSLDPSGVISYEGKWGEQAGKDSPLSWSLFGTWDAADAKVDTFKRTFPSALAIDLGPRSLVETSPKNLKYDGEYLNNPRGVVLDTWHVREKPLITKNEFNFIKLLVSTQKLKLIHFQTRSAVEFKEFLNGTATQLEELLRDALKSGADVIIEVKPQWLVTEPVRKLVQIKRRICSAGDC